MKRQHATRIAAIGMIAAVALGATACDNESGVNTGKPAASIPALPGVSVPATTTTSTKPAAAPVDYTRLLLQARDVSTTGDAYIAEPATPNPDSRPGAEVLIVNQEQTKAISILIVALDNPAAGPSALAEAQAGLAKSVNPGPAQPSIVGTGGTVVSGNSPDGTKSVTVLLFTEGSTLARVEFDGLPGQPADANFVTNVGQKQAIALRVGQPTP
ncbi:hypothetical protein FHT40_002236 [Mycolicibacterium sp. BK556]|uniref:hypothetical protein n=1 Tax=Mycobacteriaceae TaxID=1762 RepID=UPI00105F198E|nr:MULTISPECIES: hypothetical protein [Mycobacteriaceae]MBB3602603.1 hypothetical protein [Mycolicibacterium sp. BK556]MBB3632355.1 hypothetical protein [Mycolicibacterium sp. BK607]MBB3750376.1 hypothetical protein [Mycolicibacterium sp. BK634]TDO18356.1 hypothetical protein EV580_1543 [Mycobacterium sp. BK086]